MQVLQEKKYMPYFAAGIIIVSVLVVYACLGSGSVLGFKGRSGETDGLIIATFLVGLGIFFFINGFRREKIRRQVQNIPTSKIRSMATGTVELSGRADEYKLLVDPIYAQPCAYFNVKIEEYRRSGKSGYWATVYQKDSNKTPFYLRDETGRVLVVPQGAEFSGDHFTVTKKFGLFGTGPGPEKTFVESVCGTGFFSKGRSRRLVLNIIRKKTPLYVLGFSKPLPQALRDEGVPISQVARELKKNPEEMKKLDANNDGHVDGFEWDLGVAQKKKELDRLKRERELKEKPELATMLTQPLVVGEEQDAHFVIAGSEKDLLKALATSAAWQIVLGPLMVAGGLVWISTYFTIKGG